jgi:hypothetical protein
VRLGLRDVDALGCWGMIRGDVEEICGEVLIGESVCCFGVVVVSFGVGS